jgi:hypothetical protein
MLNRCAELLMGWAAPVWRSLRLRENSGFGALFLSRIPADFFQLFRENRGFAQVGGPGLSSSLRMADGAIPSGAITRPPVQLR